MVGVIPILGKSSIPAEVQDFTQCTSLFNNKKNLGIAIGTYFALVAQSIMFQEPTNSLLQR